ncbi:MAG TPA: phytanoyl-CoA dioxygenase family protein [Bradyrhizobium sp.]|nr:phytanoyl-CoA dioxygenase family protein [Bradyrhizobium sp.]
MTRKPGTPMQIQPQRPVTADEIATYRRDGVVLLKGILGREWVELLDRAIDDLARNPKGQAIDFTGLSMAAAGAAADVVAEGEWKKESEPGKKAWASPTALATNILREKAEVKEGERGHFLSLTGVFRRYQPINSLVCNSPVPAIASALMNSRKVIVYDDQILLKPPMTLEKTAWHQDNGYDHVTGDQLCGVRIPTTGETDLMGPIQYLRGSHLDGQIYKVNYFITNAGNSEDPNPEVPNVEGHEDDFDLITYCPEPGDLVVHHLRTLHGAGGNVSSTPRKAITIRYCGDDARYLYRPFAPPQDVFDLKDGDILEKDSEHHPVVWPRS